MKGQRWPSGFKRMLYGILLLVVGIPTSILLVLGVLYSAFRFHIVAVIVPVIFCASVLTIVVTTAKLSRIGFRVGIKSNDALYRHPCPHCTGGAVTLLTDDSPERRPLGWGPIPVQNRIVIPGSKYFHPPLGNVRACRFCHGRGFTLHTYRYGGTSLTDTSDSDILDA